MHFVKFFQYSSQFRLIAHRSVQFRHGPSLKHTFGYAQTSQPFRPTFMQEALDANSVYARPVNLVLFWFA